jgi:hypothetical protein
MLCSLSINLLAQSWMTLRIWQSALALTKIGEGYAP